MIDTKHLEYFDSETKYQDLSWDTIWRVDMMQTSQHLDNKQKLKNGIRKGILIGPIAYTTQLFYVDKYSLTI